MMTKRHFEALAEVLRETRQSTNEMYARNIINNVQRIERDMTTARIENGIVAMAITDNPRFDFNRFKVAATPKKR